MLERKCVKSYWPLQHRNGVTRFKQVENQSRNHALRKRTCCQCMPGNGNSFALYLQTKAKVTVQTCDRKARVASAQSFTLWQQATIEITRSLYYYLFVPHIYGCYSSRTSRSWWIAHSTQRQRRGCNKRRKLSNFSCSDFVTSESDIVIIRGYILFQHRGGSCDEHLTNVGCIQPVLKCGFLRDNALRSVGRGLPTLYQNRILTTIAACFFREALHPRLLNLIFSQNGGKRKTQVEVNITSTLSECGRKSSGWFLSLQ